MNKKIRITVLKAEVDQELEKKYAISNLGPCHGIRKGRCFTVMVSINRRICAVLPGNSLLHLQRACQKGNCSSQAEPG